MGISNYGLWKGTPTSWNGTADTDHGHLIFTDSTSSKSHEADINIMSSGKDTRLVYWLVSSYKAAKPSTSQLQAQPQGFSKQSGSNSLALDLIREGIVDVNSGVLLSHDAKNPGEKGDILSYLDPIMEEAVKSKATVYIWGSQYTDGEGASASSGIHDIHMNQGSAGSFERENGTYQDGGVVVELSGGRWEGVFLAFASQATKTDGKGNPDGPTFASALGGSSSSSSSGSGSGTQSTGSATTKPAAADPSHTAKTKGVTIEAAIVNPIGPDDAPTSGATGETVYVLNRTGSAQSLEGWTVGNEKGGSQELSGEVSAHAKRAVPVEGFRLSNKGGKIVLRDGEGEVVSEVGYSEKEARGEGKLLYFAN